jgi:hypothetical protein
MYVIQVSLTHILDFRIDKFQRIILVGGFGDSEYLRQAIKKAFGADGKIAITVPDNP